VPYSVLLVEDNDDDADFIARAFGRAKLPVSLVHFRTGEEALDFLFARGEFVRRVFEPVPAAVFLDLQLPGMHGLAVLAAIRSHPVTSAVPVLVLSGSDSAADRSAAMAGRANLFMTKPSDYAALLSQAEALGHDWLPGR
jgi:two-component system response regulator